MAITGFRISVLCISFEIFVIGQAHAQSFNVDPIEVATFQGTPAVGKRFHIETGKLLDLTSCVSISSVPKKDLTETKTANSVFTIALENEAQKIDSALGVSTDVTAGGLFWKASASASYLRHLTTTNESAYLTISSEMTLFDQSAGIGTASLLPGPAQLLAEKRLSEFVSQCGTGFVSSVTWGGSLTAVFEFHNTSESEFKQMQASLGGSYKVVSGQAQFSQTLEQVVSSHSYKLYLISRGGNAVLKEISIAELTKLATGFAPSVAASPVPVSFRVLPYATLAGTQNLQQDLDGYIRLADRISRRYVDAIVRRNTARDRASYLEAPPHSNQTFSGACDALNLAIGYRKLEASFNSYIDAMDDAIIDCGKDLQKCKSPLIPVLSLPQVPSSCMKTCKWNLSSIVSQIPYNVHHRVPLRCEGLPATVPYTIIVDASYSYVDNGACQSHGPRRYWMHINVNGVDETGVSGDGASAMAMKSISHIRVPESGAGDAGVISAAVDIWNQDNSGIPGCTVIPSGTITVAPL